MNRVLVAVNLKVQCADGCTHENVTLAVEDGRRIYATADGTPLEGVQLIDECVSVLSPIALIAALYDCKED